MNMMKQITRRTILTTSLGALVVAAICGLVAAKASAATTITVKGSDTMVILAQKWAEVYMGKNSDVKIQVSGGGTGTGFSALQTKSTDLCNASRKIKSAEIANCVKAFGKRPLEYKVAVDGLSVYVNANNPVKELSVGQLEGIFTGKIKNWKEVGGPDKAIALYSRENSSGTYEFFKEHVLKGKDFAASAETRPGTAQVLHAVATDDKGIGYGGAAYGAGAKHLPVKADDNSPAIEPTEENVLSQKYPIWRYLYIYLNPDLDKGQTASYLKWIRSNEGQKIVKDVGYFALPENLREK
jgi:phosphate transport system substrate-binding protein